MPLKQNDMLNMTTPSRGGGGGGGGGCPLVGIQLEGLILPPVLTADVILGLLGNIVALWIFCFKIKDLEPQHPVPLHPGDRRLPGSTECATENRRPAQGPLGVWRRHVSDRINLFLIFSNRSASIAFMTVVAIYCYFKWQAVYVSLFVWTLVISPRVPMLAYNHIKGSGNRTQCFSFTSYKEASQAIIVLVGMHRILTVLEFVIPMAMLLFCSIRISTFLKGRQMGQADKVRKAMRVCAAIVAVFMVCFLPTTVMTIGVRMIRSYPPWDCPAFYTFTQLTIVSLGLNFLNSALDPIIYVFSSSMFRKALCRALPRALRCGKDADKSENTTSSSGSQSTQQELKSLRTDRASEAM